MQVPCHAEEQHTGDRIARSTIAVAGRRMGWALSGIITTLNPDLIIVGGGEAAAGDLLLDPLRTRLTRQAQAPAAAAVTILPALLGADAGLLGAALLTKVT